MGNSNASQSQVTHDMWFVFFKWSQSHVNIIFPFSIWMLRNKIMDILYSKDWVVTRVFSWWQMKSHESGSILNCTWTFIWSDRFTMSLYIFQSFFILILCLRTVHVCHVWQQIYSSPFRPSLLFAPLPVCTATIWPREYNVLHLRIMFCISFACSSRLVSHMTNVCM